MSKTAEDPGVKETTVGSGMTVRKRVTYYPGTPDGGAALDAEFAAGTFDFGKKIERWEEWAIGVLRKYGLPVPPFGTRVQGHQEDSTVGYAQRIGWVCLCLRHNIEQGCAEGIAWKAYEFATVVAEMNFKRWEKVALPGKKARDGAKAGAAEKARRVAARDLKMAREYQAEQRRRPQTPSELKVEIGRRHKLKRSAAIEAVDRGLQHFVRQAGKPDE